MCVCVHGAQDFDCTYGKRRNNARSLHYLITISTHMWMSRFYVHTLHSDNVLIFKQREKRTIYSADCDCSDAIQSRICISVALPSYSSCYISQFFSSSTFSLRFFPPVKNSGTARTKKCTLHF